MAFVGREKIALVRFEKGVRKDEVMKKALRKFRGQEGVLFVGVAQEKARVPRTIRRRLSRGRLHSLDRGCWGAMGQKSSIRKMSSDFVESVERVPQRSQFAATYGFWK